MNKHSPPRKWRFLVLDNGGETADRYTVFYRSNGWAPWCDYFALSDRPDDPQGVSMCGEIWPGYCSAGEMLRTFSHVGRRVRFSALPENVRAHVLYRLKEGEA